MQITSQTPSNISSPGIFEFKIKLNKKTKIIKTNYRNPINILLYIVIMVIL